MSYQVPQHIDSNKVFLINHSELEGRLDPQYYEEHFDFHNFVKLSSIAKVSGGKRIPLGKDYSLEPTEFLYLRVADIQDEGIVDFSQLKCIDEDVYDTLKRYEIYNGNLAISIAGTVGKVVIINGIPIDKHVILTENCAKITILSNEILAEYLHLMLSLPIVQRQIELNYIQTTIPKLGLDRVNGLMLPKAPSVSSQHEIINVYKVGIAQKSQKEQQAEALLQSIDDYLLGELGIQLPETKSQTLQDRMFLVNRNDLEDRFDPYYSQEYFRKAFAILESGKYPVVNLKTIAKLITSGITPKSGGDAYTEDKSVGVPFVRSGNISIDGELDYDDLLYLKPEVHNTIMKSSQLKKNDILIAIVGATIGQVGIYLSEREANINQAIALVRLKDGYNIQFIKELLKSSVGQLSLNRLKRPVARANINLEEISQIKVILPPEEKQQEIVDHISLIRQQAKVLQEEGKAILEQAKKEVEQMILG